MSEVIRFPSIADDTYNLFDSPNQTGSPERRLILAVLERSILDFVGNDSKEMEEARAWIFDNNGSDCEEEFSFRWVCRELDLDYTMVLTTIKNMPRRGARRIAPWYFDKPVCETSTRRWNRSDNIDEEEELTALAG